MNFFAVSLYFFLHSNRNRGYTVGFLGIWRGQNLQAATFVWDPLSWALPAPTAPADGAMVMGMWRSLAPSRAIFGAMTVRTPDGEMVDVTVSGFTPLGKVTRRRNLSANCRISKRLKQQIYEILTPWKRSRVGQYVLHVCREW